MKESSGRRPGIRQAEEAREVPAATTDVALDPAPEEGVSSDASPEGLYGHHAHWDTTSFGARRKADQVRRMYDRYVGPLPDGATLLEIGPGRGELAELLRRRGVGYLGIEPSEALYRSLQERGFDVVRSTVPPIPAADATMTVVYSVDVFEHFYSYREAMAVCVESLRVLRPRGLLVIVAPNAETLGKLFYQYEYQHSFVTNKGRLEEMARDAGFEVVESGAFLTTLGLTSAWPVDRVLAHVLIPIARSSLFVAFFRLFGLERLLFRIHKVLCDHVGVVARKPEEVR